MFQSITKKCAYFEYILSFYVQVTLTKWFNKKGPPSGNDHFYILYVYCLHCGIEIKTSTYAHLLKFV